MAFLRRRLSLSCVMTDSFMALDAHVDFTAKPTPSAHQLIAMLTKVVPWKPTCRTKLIAILTKFVPLGNLLTG
jgi:hypothetical protein